MDNDMIYYSRCSVGKSKWFWIAKTEDAYFEGRDPFAYGFAGTAQEAEALALAAAQKEYPDWKTRQVHTSTAGYFKRCLVAREKAKKQSGSTTAAQVEYLYRDSMSDYDCSWSSTPHRIVKKTKKKVFVDREPYYPQFDKFQYGDWRDFADQRTITLDRQELEEKGEAWSRTRRDFFYTTPHEERRHHMYVPDFGKQLKLVAPWTTGQVKQAFRCLVKKAHPDSGGDGDEFKKLYRAYEQALGMAEDRVAG